MISPRKKLGEILTALSVMSPGDVDAVLATQKRRPDARKFGQMALSLGFIRAEHIVAALAVQMELFPEIENMPLKEILRRINDPALHATSHRTPGP